MLTNTLEQTYYVIDFDSTFTQVEGLDELANIALAGNPNREKIVQQIRDLTEKGMNGEMSFAEGLRSRVSLLQANRSHIDALVDFLRTKISDSFIRNRTFLKDYADTILIVSSGFKEFIVPIVTELGLKEENVYANTFRFDEEGNIIGLDDDNVLSQDKGKVKLLQSLQLQGDVCAIGDGYTDYELRESGVAQHFYAFTENVERENVTKVADYVVPSLDDFLFLKNLVYPGETGFKRQRHVVGKSQRRGTRATFGAIHHNEVGQNFALQHSFHNAKPFPWMTNAQFETYRFAFAQGA